MNWTHANFTESLHEGRWIVGEDGTLRGEDDDPHGPFAAWLRVRIRIFKGIATIEVQIVDAACQPWAEHCEPQFVFEADAPDPGKSSQELVKMAHGAAQHLAQFYAPFKRVSRYRPKGQTLQG